MGCVTYLKEDRKSKPYFFDDTLLDIEISSEHSPIGLLEVIKDGDLKFIPLFSPLSIRQGDSLKITSNVGVRSNVGYDTSGANISLNNHHGTDLIVGKDNQPNRNAKCLKLLKEQKFIRQVTQKDGGNIYGVYNLGIVRFLLQINGQLQVISVVADIKGNKLMIQDNDLDYITKRYELNIDNKILSVSTYQLQYHHLKNKPKNIQSIQVSTIGYSGMKTPNNTHLHLQIIQCQMFKDKQNFTIKAGLLNTNQFYKYYMKQGMTYIGNFIPNETISKALYFNNVASNNLKWSNRFIAGGNNKNYVFNNNS